MITSNRNVAHLNCKSVFTRSIFICDKNDAKLIVKESFDVDDRGDDLSRCEM